MPSTPTSKCSTSTTERSLPEVIEDQEQLRAALTKALADGAMHKRLLEELLAEIHRDGGQFTKLAGLMTSLSEAHKVVMLQRKKISSLLFNKKR